LGFALSALAYGFLYAPLEAWHKGYGWRGMLILGVLPALVCLWIRAYVKEPEVWTENQKNQDTQQAQVTLPLFAIFKRKYLFNTLTACLWMAANFCVYYSVWSMLSTYLQKELHWTPAEVAVPVFWGNIITFVACSFWGAVSESVGRRWALMIPMTVALFIIPLYLSQTDPTLFLGFFLLFICFFSGKDCLNPAWLSERFPTEVRATASGFVFHQGAIFGAAVAPILTYFAVNKGMGFVTPMMYGAIGSTIVFLIAVYLGPETKGMVMTAELEVIDKGGVPTAVPSTST
jgi:MFS transporter, SHS family, lactate transporter